MNPTPVLADATFFVMLLIGTGLFYLIKSHSGVGTDPLIAVWKKAAKVAELNYVRAFELEGARGDLSIRAEIVSDGSGGSATQWTRVVVTGDLTTSFSIKAAGGLLLSLRDPDVEVGDPSFDKAVKLHGLAATALAVFDAAARPRVQHLVEQGWAFEDGAWVFQARGRLGTELGTRLAEGSELAEIVRAGQRDIPARLSLVAASDPSPAVRGRALESLVTDFGGRAETRSALQAARSDTDPAIRLFAALKLDDREALALLASDAAVAAELRIAAFEELLRVEPQGRGAAAITTAWLSSSSDGFAGSMDQASLRAAALTALAAVPHEHAQSVLIEALAADDEGVKLAAVRALAKVGTVEAVAALIPLRDAFRGSVLKAAAGDTILAIQARVPGGEVGALALSEDGGGLAITQSEEA